MIAAGVVVVLAAATGGAVVGRRAVLDRLHRQQQQRDYAAGHAAYQKADCQAAMPALARADRRDADLALARAARTEKAACQALEDVRAVPTAPERLMAYVRYVQGPTSLPFKNTARTEGAALLDQGVAKLATTDVCDHRTGLVDSRVLAEDKRQDFLPPLILRCAVAFDKAGHLAQAETTYREVVDDYPLSKEAPKANQAAARLMVARAAAGPKEKPTSFLRLRRTGRSPAMLVIYNSTPTEITVAVDGPSGQVKQIKACKSCPRYRPTDRPRCRLQGPKVEIRLDPGTYRVAVLNQDWAKQLVSKRQRMQGGTLYGDCFFTVRNTKK